MMVKMYISFFIAFVFREKVERDDTGQTKEFFLEFT